MDSNNCNITKNNMYYFKAIKYGFINLNAYTLKFEFKKANQYSSISLKTWDNFSKPFKRPLSSSQPFKPIFFLESPYFDHGIVNF